jgi:hypothetical protein
LGNWKHTGNTVRTVDLPSPNDAHRQLWAAGNICFPTLLWWHDNYFLGHHPSSRFQTPPSCPEPLHEPRLDQNHHVSSHLSPSHVTDQWYLITGSRIWVFW